MEWIHLVGFFFFILIFCVLSVTPVLYICASYVCLVLVEAKEAIQTPGSGVTGGSELLCASSGSGRIIRALNP